MTKETETPTLEMAMASCAACDLMFMASERRQTCPTCGGEAVGPYFEFVLDESGLHQKDGAVEDKRLDEGWVSDRIEEQHEEATAPVEEEEPAGEGAPDNLTVLLEAISSFLGGADSLEEDIREWLGVRMGADRDAVATAVGRLVAVRDLIRELAGMGVEVQAEVEVEGSPEAAPEPSPAGDNGSEAV